MFNFRITGTTMTTFIIVTGLFIPRNIIIQVQGIGVVSQQIPILLVVVEIGFKPIQNKLVIIYCHYPRLARLTIGGSW